MALPKKKVGDGTKTLPGLAFESDADTGLYLAGAADLRASVAGNDVLKLTAGIADAVAGLKVGTGGEINKVLTAAGTYSATVGPDGIGSATVTVTGAAVGDPVLVGLGAPNTGDNTKVAVSAQVTATDTVGVTVRNDSLGSLQWISAALKIVVFSLA